MFQVTTLELTDPPKQQGKVDFAQDFFDTQAGEVGAIVRDAVEFAGHSDAFCGEVLADAVEECLDARLRAGVA